MIELKDVCWNTPDGRPILQNVNLKIKENRLVAISGPNGGGKTTLAKIIMGLETPTSGRIFLDGEDVTDLDVTERAQHDMSYGFQQPVHFKGITVRHLLLLSAGHPLTEKHLRTLIQKVGLNPDEYLDRDVDATLSGGEIKRIEIASVLARDSRFVIFDEPEAGIDLWSFESLINVFEDMRNKHNKTLVVISHQERILRIADEIVIVSDGTVSDRGPGPEMLAHMMRSKSYVARHAEDAEVCYA